jgi:hypothetical protein
MGWVDGRSAHRAHRTDNETKKTHYGAALVGL